MAGLALEIEGRTIPLEGSGTLTIGRDAGASVTVVSELVSRRHLEVACQAGRWLARDLDTLNGTFLNGAQLPPLTPFPLQPGTDLMLGDPAEGARVRVVPVAEPAWRSAGLDPVNGITLSGRMRVIALQDPSLPGAPSAPGFTTSTSVITIGRSPDNAIVVHDPMVSAHHARLTALRPGHHLVEDLRSTNGTFVDGVRVSRQEIGPGSIVSLGKIFLKATVGGLIRVAQEYSAVAGQPSGSRISLSVSDVTFSVATSKHERSSGGGPRKALLDRVTFNVPERSLLAVIGPSGAGKSTMLKTMIGTLKPDSGQVLFNGLDMAVFANSMADRIGMVPQDDLVHSELTARHALEYAARLRFPDDSTAADRWEAVEWAIRELGLTPHADTRIRQLSGGQRKRVSTAMELLTKPDLLFLDEPTSGLDPNLDREVMELLRDLAHGTPQNPTGRTVVVITHSTDNLDKADNVLLLAPGGKVAYFGPPEQLQRFFDGKLRGDSSYASIYGLIAQHPDAAHAAFAASPLAPRSAPIVPQQAGTQRAAGVRPKRLLPQMLTLLGRQSRLMAADRSLLAFTLALPIVVGLLTLAVNAAAGFSAATTAKAVGQPRILLVVVVFGSVLMGMVPSVRQLVSERAIFKREAGVGVRPAAYLASKIVLLGVVCAAQSGLLVSVTLSLNPHPDNGVMGPLGFELFLVSLGISWTCAALGLLLSGLVSTSEQVMPLMVLVLMFQLVMCGGVLDVSGPGINQVSQLAPSRWGYAAGASSLDFNTTIICNAQVLAKAKEDEEVNKQAREATDDANQEAADQAAANGLPEPTPKQAKVQDSVVDCATVDDQDRLWDHTGTRWVANLLALVFWFGAYSAGTLVTLRRLTR